MSGTVTFLNSATMTHGRIQNTFPGSSVSLTQTNPNVYDATITLSTTEEALSFTDFVGDPMVILDNLDSSITIDWGLTGSYPASIKANDPPAQFRVKNGATIYLMNINYFII